MLTYVKSIDLSRAPFVVEIELTSYLHKTGSDSAMKCHVTACVHDSREARLVFSGAESTNTA